MADRSILSLSIEFRMLLFLFIVAIGGYALCLIVKKLYAYGMALPPPEVKPEPEKEEPYFAFNWKRAILGKMFLGDFGFFLFGFNKNPKYKGDDIKFI